MIRIGVLHEIMAQSMQRANRQRMGKLELAFGTERLADFMERLQSTRVDALLVSLDLLEDQPLEKLQRIQSMVQPEVVIVSYFFTRSSTLNALREAPGIHPMRSPITLEAIRAELDSLGVEAPKQKQSMNPGNVRVATPREQINHEQPSRRFSDMQIKNLQGVRSQVDCECPQHAASLLASLNRFEEYSRECENKNDKDAKIHAMLYRATGHARALVEEATGQLCRHEGIEVDRWGNTRMDLMDR